LDLAPHVARFDCMDTVELFKDRFDAPEAASAESSYGENCAHVMYIILVGRSLYAYRTLD
jgi:hypothetical protein